MLALDRLPNNHPTDSAEDTTLGEVLMLVHTAAYEASTSVNTGNNPTEAREKLLIDILRAKKLGHYARMIAENPDWEEARLSDEEVDIICRILFSEAITQAQKTKKPRGDRVSSKQGDRPEAVNTKHKRDKVELPVGYISLQQATFSLHISPNRLREEASKMSVLAMKLGTTLSYRKADIEQIRTRIIDEIITEIITLKTRLAILERQPPKNKGEQKRLQSRLSTLTVQLNRMGADSKILAGIDELE